MVSDAHMQLIWRKIMFHSNGLNSNTRNSFGIANNPLNFSEISCHLSVLLIFSFSSVLFHILFLNIFFSGFKETLPGIRRFLFFDVV